MFGFLLTLLILDGVLLAVVVLLQAGKGGGLAAMGGASAGTDSLIGGRQAATLLTKATWIAGGLFLTLALMLSVLSSRAQQPTSVLRGLQQNTPAATPQPVQIPGTQPAPSSGQPAGTQAPNTQGQGAPTGGQTPPSGSQPAPNQPAGPGGR